MLVEYAMSTFGTVVKGVGTLHAPYSMWGLAATLQKIGAHTDPYYFIGSTLFVAALYTRRRTLTP